MCFAEGATKEQQEAAVKAMEPLAKKFLLEAKEKKARRP